MYRWMFIIVTALVMGCSGPEDLDETNSDEQKGRFGLVYVNYDHDWDATGQDLVLNSTAQFVQYTALDRDQVAKLLAMPLDPERDLPPLEKCRLYDLSVDLVADDSIEETGTVELLEAGDLQVHTAGHVLTLSPRHFPWLLPFISGVIYGESQTTLTKKPNDVKVLSAGGETIGGFSAQVVSPTLPQLKEVGGHEPSQLIPTVKDQDLLLRWEAANYQSNDVTYLELRFTKGKQDLALRCRPKDDGAFEIPHSGFKDFSGQVTIELARLRRTAFTAAGLAQGELRITVRERANLSF